MEPFPMRYMVRLNMIPMIMTFSGHTKTDFVSNINLYYLKLNTPNLKEMKKYNILNVKKHKYTLKASC